MPVGVLGFDGKGRVTCINSRLTGWLGYANGANVDLQLRNIVAGDGAALLVSISPGSAGSPSPIALDLLTEDGRLWPATLLVQPDGEMDGASTFTARGSAGRDAITPTPVATSDTQGVANHMQSAPFGIATRSMSMVGLLLPMAHSTD